jgi:hypothetical protein
VTATGGPSYSVSPRALCRAGHRLDAQATSISWSSNGPRISWYASRKTAESATPGRRGRAPAADGPRTGVRAAGWRRRGSARRRAPRRGACGTTRRATRAGSRDHSATSANAHDSTWIKTGDNPARPSAS